jgi:hypothetical protein
MISTTSAGEISPPEGSVIEPSTSDSIVCAGDILDMSEKAKAENRINRDRRPC